MKLTVAATFMASSVSATDKSPSSPAGESLRNAIVDSNHRSLAVSTKDRQDIAAILKERRALKRQNGRVFHNFQNKLRNLNLRNQAEEVGNVPDADLDLGFFSRNLQSNVTEPETGGVIEDLLDLCTGENAVPGFSCSCSNVDVDAYTANVMCAYDSNCLEPTPNACQGNATFCFVETYELEVSGPGAGSSQICYDVNSPINFTYCYGLTYSEDTGSPQTCFLEVDNIQCNSCEFTYESSAPNITCNQFDCTNIDDAIGSGVVCGDDTIVSKKIEDYLVYGPLPCEGGCNICPKDGEMMNLYNNVTMITGEEYSCSQLNLAALMGYLQDVPGDLCNVLPSLVNEPCECISVVEETSPPSVANETSTEITEEKDPAEDAVETDGGLSEETDEVEEPTEYETSGGAGLSQGLRKFDIAAATASVLSWILV
jgi:hypothetical protein